ncbi:pyridoxamine 5'-phosphate oxidase family protein [Aquimarina sp. RZ0]|uniref:pyridoxamine 5'-phosphate oxidase family protein n=1 Tax=Aquimarina sp. RZ0 TaxID=2607730 RepID=UPI0011F3F38C|nr:pyridoxamine 5'-phosphate oxidase family protein [Aquimarina sp. RZ0]KAA1246358.1 pyridoxamine 5'-phosphate oxidase family protein [Aquimarina sp. RZ0]
MAKFYPSINKRTKEFIEAQKIFFVATAPIEGRINLSPKGMDTFRVLDEERVVWLSVTGSGNETDAHLLENDRITIMFCAFEGAPNILRIFGKGRAVHPEDEDWNDLISLFPKLPGTRQIFDVQVESVQTSCGMSIPYFEYKEERNQLIEWATNKGEDGLKAYRQEKNQKSIDGLPTRNLN